MTRKSQSIAFCLSLLAILRFGNATAQSVLDPNDPVVDYNPASPPVQPGWMEMGKWVRTSRGYGNWTNRYKAYIWQGMAFRLRFPNGYIPANDGKKYPLIIFLHGRGEIYTQYPNYDNEFQLLQGPPKFDNDINNALYPGVSTKPSWNGYVLAPQVADGYYFGDFERIMQIVDYMIANNKVDPFRISINGLSSGGLGCWQLFNLYPKYVASLTPMSSPVQQDFQFFPYNGDYIANKKFTPIWNSQGGDDTNPYPFVTQAVEDSMKKYGANYKRTVYPGVAHGTWFGFWDEPDFWPFMNRTYMSNPWMLGGPVVVWPGQVFSPKTIGVQPGFDDYEWRRNGTTIPGQHSNTLVVTAPGTYQARIRKGTLWSDWSWTPLKISTRFEAENYTNKNGAVAVYQCSDPADNNKDGFPTTTCLGFGDGSPGSAGAWLEYSINPAIPGQYDLSLRASGYFGGGQLQVKSGSTVLATINIPGTGSFDNWITVTTPVTLPAGPQTLRLTSMTASGWFLNSFVFSQAGASPLPVKYVYFNSECEGSVVNLKWKTAQEQNSRNFSVQRSADGRSWSAIGSVAAAGQSAEERTYAFADKTPAGAGFYRIVEYGYDEQTTISSTIRSSCSAATELTLYPNPSSDNTSVGINLQQKTSVKIQVIDGRGAVLQQKLIQLPAGSSNIPLNVSDYASGIYTIMVQYNGEVKTLKLFKK